MLCLLCVLLISMKDASAEGIVSSKQYEDLRIGLLLDETEQSLVLDFLRQKKEKDAKDKKNINAASTDKEVSIQRQLALGEKAFYDKKYKKSFKILMPIARHGKPKAMELTGIMYRLGNGIEQDPKLAFEWLKKAAQQNLPIAQHHLGIMLYTGETGNKNYITALMYLHLAVNNYGNGLAKDQAIKDRDAVSKLVSRLEREKAQKMAKNWMQSRKN